MKKPLFKEVERRIICENNSLSADRMNLQLAVRRFNREFERSNTGKFFRRALQLLT